MILAHLSDFLASPFILRLLFSRTRKKQKEPSHYFLVLHPSFWTLLLSSSCRKQLSTMALWNIGSPAHYPTICWVFHRCLHPLVRSLTGISQNCFHRCEGAVVLKPRVLRHCTAVVQVRTLYPRKPNSPQYLSGKHMHFNDFECFLPIM